jgi:hypothetical protein
MKNRSWHLLAWLLLGGSLFATCAAAQTSLNGEVITTTYLFPDTGTIFSGPVDTTVPGGISNFAGFADISFSGHNILITADRNAQINDVLFDGFVFFDPNGIFSTVTLDGSSTYAGLTASGITFNANQIFVNVVGLPGLSGQTISLDINSPSPTPEPSTVLLYGTGMLALFGLKKKSKTCITLRAV